MSVVEIMIVTLKLRVIIWLDLTLVHVMKAIRVLALSVLVSFSKRKKNQMGRCSKLCVGCESNTILRYYVLL